MASRVRIGSPANGWRARSTTSGPMRSTVQCDATVASWARRSAASASVSSPKAAARRSSRSHSMSVKSEATTSGSAAKDSRMAVADSSSSSQASTALDSAYRLNGTRAPHPEAERRRACGALCGAIVDTSSHRRRRRGLRVLASRAQAIPEAPTGLTFRALAALVPPRFLHGRSRAPIRPNVRVSGTH
jgi:hypothetical protein